MSRMYVANCSAQIQDFHYRVLGTTQVRRQRIGPEDVQVLSGQLTTEEIANIADQHAIYGMIAAHEVNQARKHIYLMYSVDRPVTPNQMSQAIERNLALMSREGEQRRREAAIFINNTLADDNPRDFRTVEVSVQEDVKDGGVPRVNESITVQRPGHEPAPEIGRRGRRGLRRAAA